MSETFATRVSAGIAYLLSVSCNYCTDDKCSANKLPGGTLEKVDTKALDLDSSYECVLGQIGSIVSRGSYFKMADYLGLGEERLKELGFITRSGERATDLTAEWVKQLDEKYGNASFEVGDVLKHKRYALDGLKVVTEFESDGKKYVVVHYGTLRDGKLVDKYTQPNVLLRDDLTSNYGKVDSYKPKAGDFFKSNGKIYFLDNEDRAWNVSGDVSRYTAMSYFANGSMEAYTSASGTPLNINITA